MSELRRESIPADRTSSEPSRESHSPKHFTRGFLSCETTGDRARALACAAFGALLIAGIIDFCCCLVMGPSSLGIMCNPYRLGFFATCLFMAASVFVFRKQLGDKPENLFLVMLLCCTCLTSISFSTNRVSWDCSTHFEFMLEFATPDMQNELTQAEVNSLVPDPTTRSNIAELNEYNQSLDALDSIDTPQVATPKASLFNRVASLPGSALYLLLTVLGLPFTFKFVATRLIYAVIYALVCFAGMKKLRSGKMLYAVIAMLPTAVFLAANYSYDYWINAFVLYAGATLVGEFQHQEQTISWKSVVLMLGAFVLAFAPKAVYFPLLLLCLLLPKQKFASKKNLYIYRLLVFASIAVLVVSFCAPMLLGGLGAGDTRGGGAVNASAQVAYIMSSPMHFMSTLFTFSLGYLSLGGTRGFMAFWAYIGYPSFIIWFIIIGLFVVTTITDKDKDDVALCTWKNRIIALIVSLITIGIVEAALYVEFTAVGAPTIEGCQPRYLIPLLFLFLVFLSTPKFGIPRKRFGITRYNAVILSLLTICLLATEWQLVISLVH